MTISRMAAAVAIVVGCWSAPVASIAAADQDTLARAKALYTSAAYDEALALLNQFQNGSLNDALEVDQYRAFCLLALGRGDDARQVIQRIVEAHPTFHPSQTQMSPRLLDAFREVRRRVLPPMVRQSYADAKAAFERKEFDKARSGFNTVLTLLDDEDARASGDLSDLRMLSNGFLSLIKTMPVVEERPAPAPPAPEAAHEPAPVTAPAVYDARSVDVKPPVPISQVAPPWHPTRQQLQAYEGTLTLMIDEHGAVISVSADGNLHPEYVASLRKAASHWKYRPATKGGVPVQYRKQVTIRLSPLDADRTNKQER
jgi:tetratricopeptide (TPR) repeat protein